MRVLQKALLVVLGLFAGTVASAAAPSSETVFREAFADAAKTDSRLRWDRRQWRDSEGSLRPVRRPQSVSAFRVRDLALEDWRLSFRVKRFFVPDQDQHFGVIFAYGDDTTLRIYCRGNAVFWWDQAGKKTRAHKRLGENLAKPMPSGDDAPWSRFAISTQAAYVQVDLDGRRVGIVRREPARLRSAQFYTYRVDTGFDDIHFERLSAPAERSARTAAPELTLYAAFESTTAIRGRDGEVAARAAQGLTFTDGVFGQAVRVSTADGAKPLLEYDAGDAFKGAGGTVMFWFRPEWDGQIQDPKHFTWYGLFSSQDEAGKIPLRIWQWSWLRSDLSGGDGPKGFSLYHRCRGSWMAGDWRHVALVWNEGGWCTMYADGVPYERGLTGDRYLPKRQPAVLDAIRTFSIGSLPGGGAMKTANGAFDELRIYRAPLSAEQVAAEIHRALPVDVIAERRFVRAGVKGELTLGIYPGGRMVVPAVGKEVTTPVAVKVRTRLVAEGETGALAEQTSDAEVSDEVLLTMGVPPLTVDTGQE